MVIFPLTPPLTHFGDRQRLRLQTSGEEAPDLSRTELLQTEAGWHKYVFDALPALLAEAPAQASGADRRSYRGYLRGVGDMNNGLSL